MSDLFSFFSSGLGSIGPFFLLLGLLIFVHELGHFLVARWCGVRVETFSLGFGKKIIKWVKGDTTYCISLIPLGGYVKMYGDDPTADIPASEKKNSFIHKPVGQRIAIVLAGPLMNLFFAIVLFALVAVLGERLPGPQLGDVNPDSVAFKVGFRSGDKILKIDGAPMGSWSDIKEVIEDHAEKPLSFLVEREGGGDPVELTVTPERKHNLSAVARKRYVGEIPGFNFLAEAPLVALTDNSGPAAKAGFHPVEQILAINGREVKFRRELPRILSDEAQKGDKLLFKLRAFEQGGPSREREIAISANLATGASGGDLLSQLGIESSNLTLLRPRQGSPAAAAGLQHGDRILAVDESPISSWDQFVASVKSYSGGDKPLTLHVRRQGQELSVPVQPALTEMPNAQGGFDKNFMIGVMPAIASTAASEVVDRTANPLVALKTGLVKSWEWTVLMAIGIAKLVSGEVSPRNISGVITIGQLASESFAVGISVFVRMMGIISINLFLLNLLPIPILDGGHLLFYTIEAIRGAPMSMRKMEIAQQIGLVLLLLLMAFALFNDILRIKQNSW